MQTKVNKAKETKVLKPTERKQLLRERVGRAKERLPNDWRKRLAVKYPMYDKLEFADLLNRVYSLRTADVSLTNILEEIANEFEKEMNSLGCES